MRVQKNDRVCKQAVDRLFFTYVSYRPLKGMEVGEYGRKDEKKGYRLVQRTVEDLLNRHFFRPIMIERALLTTCSPSWDWNCFLSSVLHPDISCSVISEIGSRVRSRETFFLEIAIWLLQLLLGKSSPCNPDSLRANATALTVWQL